MTYNTQRDQLIISEYGRSVHHMAKYLLTVEDAAKRQLFAESLVEVMAILNSQMKGVEDVKQRYWDHLFVLTDYKLDVVCPYGAPQREAKEAKPEPIPYPARKIRWNHLGRNVETLYKKAIAETDSDKQKGYAQALGFYIKTAYKNNHDENVTDESVKEELLQMSSGVLSYEANEFRKWVDGTLSESVHANAPKNNVRNDAKVTGKAYYQTGGSGVAPSNRGGQGAQPQRKNKFNKFKRR
jgi:ribosomal protein S16